MSEATRGNLAIVSPREAVQDMLEYAQGDHTALRTGWSIDQTCGTLFTGELGLVWARSSVGKSTVILNMLNNTREIPTLMMSMEMPPRRQIEWLTSMSHRWLTTPSRDIPLVLMRGPADPAYDSVTKAVHETAELFSQVYFVMPKRPSVDDLNFILDDIEGETGVRPVRVIIDHLGLMGDCSDYQGYVRTASELHSFAIKQQVGVYALQQTGRGNDAGGMQRNNGHLPITLNSGVFAGEADADMILGLYRPERNPDYQPFWRFVRDPVSRFRDWAWLNDPDKAEAKWQRFLSVRDITVLQVIKNRSTGEVNEAGIRLLYDHFYRTLTEEP